jgi:hypothetical protein
VTTYLIDKAAADADASRQERRMKTSAETRSQHEGRRQWRPTPNVDQILDDSFPASDPPSWTGSIWRLASTPERESSSERLVRRIRSEFLEVPGLCLTIQQAQRLWSLEPRACEALLNSLIDSRFLRRTARGLFVLRPPRLRVACCSGRTRSYGEATMPTGDIVVLVRVLLSVGVVVVAAVRSRRGTS